MQHATAQYILSGWGQTPKETCTVYRPEKPMRVLPTSFIARGCGRSYGDASLNPDGVVLHERLDCFLAFDKEAGTLTAQAGVTIAEILNLVIPHGWIVPVIAGTKHVSLGGAVAANIHGKNHYMSGDFVEHVISFLLLTPDGNRLLCSREEHADVFRATSGGMGMTGCIEEVSVQLRPIQSLSLQTYTRTALSIHDMIDCFEQSRDNAGYMIGWIDHFAKGDRLGRGVFEKAVHVSEKQDAPCQAYQPAKQKITIPQHIPSLLLNRYTMALYNRLRFARYTSDWREETVNFDGFFHPLDQLGKWYRLYGKRGFFQYQCVIPEHEQVADDLHGILSHIQQKELFSYLAVIKYHRNTTSMMGFPMRGYSLALDFPNTPDTRQLQHALNHKVAELGGRVYLAKDACLSAELFERMYAHVLPQWREVLKRIDPDKRCHSLMAERLGFRHD